VGLRFLRPHKVTKGPFEVTELVSNGVAKRNGGIQVGGTILVVDGCDVSRLIGADVALIFRGQPATALELAILTSNRERERSAEQEAALNQLAEMGFTDRNGNKKLLEQSRNDVAIVVDLLSQEASTNQRRENEVGSGRSGESEDGSGRGSCLEEGRCYVDTSRNLGSGSFPDVVGGTY
jgi:hypothetical protein